MADIVGGSVVWNLDANNDKFNSQLDSASKSIQSLDGKLKAAQGGSQAFAAGLAVVGAAAVAFGVSSVQAYESAHVAQTKLATNLLNVKGNTMANVDALGKLASQLQAVGVIEDDAIKAGMSQLATFNLQGKTIATLTPKIADMVAQLKGHNATAEDMVGINNLVGKVMTGNIGALAKYGVTVSDAQKKQFEASNETQKAALLNEILAQNYGKVNEALRNTPQGQITAFKNTFGDFQEIVGETLMLALTPFIKSLNDLMTAAGGPEGMMRKLTDTFKAIQPWMPVIAGAIIGALIPAVYGLATAFIALMVPLLPFIAVGVALGLLFIGIKKGLELMEPVFKAFGEVVGAVAKAIVGYFTWLGDIIFGFIDLIFKGDFTGKFGRALGIDEDSPIMLAFFKFRNTITGFFKTLGDIFFGFIDLIFKGDFTGKFGRAIGISEDSPIILGFFWLRNNIVSILGNLAGFLTGTWTNLYNFFASIGNKIVDAITKPFRDAKASIERIANEIRNAANNINPFVRHSPSLVDNVTKGIGIIKDQYNSLKDISLPSISGMAPAYAGMPTMSALSSDLGESSGGRSGGDVNIYVDKIQNIEDVKTIDQKLGFLMLVQ